jgi:hypothetical protein
MRNLASDACAAFLLAGALWVIFLSATGEHWSKAQYGLMIVGALVLAWLYQTLREVER